MGLGEVPDAPEDRPMGVALCTNRQDADWTMTYRVASTVAIHP